MSPRVAMHHRTAARNHSLSCRAVEILKPTRDRELVSVVSLLGFQLTVFEFSVKKEHPAWSYALWEVAVRVSRKRKHTQNDDKGQRWRSRQTSASAGGLNLRTGADLQAVLKSSRFICSRPLQWDGSLWLELCPLVLPPPPTRPPPPTQPITISIIFSGDGRLLGSACLAVEVRLLQGQRPKIDFAEVRHIERVAEAATRKPALRLVHQRTFDRLLFS